MINLSYGYQLTKECEKKTNPNRFFYTLVRPSTKNDVISIQIPLLFPFDKVNVGVELFRRHPIIDKRFHWRCIYLSKRLYQFFKSLALFWFWLAARLKRLNCWDHRSSEIFLRSNMICSDGFGLFVILRAILRWLKGFRFIWLTWNWKRVLSRFQNF